LTANRKNSYFWEKIKLFCFQKCHATSRAILERFFSLTFSVERQISSKQELLKEVSGLWRKNRRFSINLKLLVVKGISRIVKNM
jgi:hypothetical protein